MSDDRTAEYEENSATAIRMLGRAERSQQVLWIKLNERGKPKEHAVRIVVEELAPGLKEAAQAHPVLVALLRAHGWAA